MHECLGLGCKSSRLNWNAQYGNLANRWLSDNRAVLLVAIRCDRGMNVLSTLFNNLRASRLPIWMIHYPKIISVLMG